MAEFLTVPAVVKVAEAGSLGRARWRIEDDLRFLDDSGVVWTVRAGEVTDFSSVPRLPFAYWLAGDTAHMSAVFHDYLCRSVYPDLLTWREAADLFLQAMRAEKVPAWRRWGMYWAVRLFGEPLRGGAA